MEMAIPTRTNLTMLCVFTLLTAAVAGSFTGCGVGGGGSTKPYSPPPTPPPTANSEFADYFEEHAVDLSTWVVHGNGVSVSNGRLRVDSHGPWESGVEGVEHFFRPRENDYLTVSGAVFFPADSLGSTSIVHVQDHWRTNDPDCLFFEFVRNRDSYGDNEIYFGAKVDGNVVEHVSLGSFVNGATVDWTLTVYPDYCVAEAGSESFSTSADVQDLGLSLHGSGSATYWNSVAVTLWDVH